jgi:hypothetical protein
MISTMKRFILPCLMAMAVHAAGAPTEVNFLYASDGTAIKLADFPDFLEQQFSRNVPVVLYVHGRAKLPVWSRSKREIERQYWVTCVMFHWDSAFPGVRFWDRNQPLSQVPEAAGRLREVLARVPSKEARAGGRVTLLVHSMGSLVLQGAAMSGGFPDTQLFDYVLLTEPDCDAQDHISWVEPLARTERVFITQNRDDTILNHAGATRAKGIFSLGLGVDEPKAEGACYLDLSGLVDNNHRLFSLGALEDQVHVAQTIRGILRGEDDHPAASAIASQEGSTIRLKSLRDAKHAIFGGFVEEKGTD